MLVRSIKSLLALALWASGSLWQPSAAEDAPDPQRSTLVTLTITSLSPLPLPPSSTPAEITADDTAPVSSPGVPHSSSWVSDVAPSSRGPIAHSSEIGLPSSSKLSVIPPSTSDINSIPAWEDPSSATASDEPVVRTSSAGPQRSSTDAPAIQPSRSIYGSSSRATPKGSSSPIAGATPSDGGSSSVSGVSTTAAPTSIAPTETTVSSSASAFSTDVVSLYPLIQTWIKTPEPPQATPLIDAIKDKIPEEPPTGSCQDMKRRGIRRDLFQSLTDAIGCTTYRLRQIESDVEDTINTDDSDVESKVKDVSSILEDEVKPTIDTLDDMTPEGPGDEPSDEPDGPDDPDDDPDDSPDDEPTQSPTASPTSPAPTTASTSTSSSSSATSTSTPTSTSEAYCSEDCSACVSDDAVPAGLKGSSLLKRSSDGKSKRGADGAVAERALTHPTDADWFTWFLDQTQNALKIPHGNHFGAPSTAMMWPLIDTAASYALVNLYGCSSLILVSKYGMYMSHFWQLPSFEQLIERTDEYGNVISRDIEFNQGLFTNDVLDALSNGAILSDWHWFTGSVDQEYFNLPDAETEAIIITPYQFGSSDIRYPEQVSQIKDKLHTLLPNMPDPLVQGYINVNERDPRIDNPAFVSDMEWTYGKVLLQYDPDNGRKWTEDPETNTKCSSVHAGLEVILGDAVLHPILTKGWEATSEQLNLEKRDSSPMCSKSMYSSASLAASAPFASGASASAEGSSAAAPTTFKTSPARSGSVTSSSAEGPLCIPTSGPDMEDTKCACPVGANSHRILPTLPSSDDMCGYDSIPDSMSTATPTPPTPTSTPVVPTPPTTLAPTPSQYCLNRADPDNSEGNVCQCSSTSAEITFYTTLTPDSQGGCDLYTSYPETHTTTGFPFTTTDAGGAVLAYKSSTLSHFQYGSTKNTYTFGAGPSTVLTSPTPTAKWPFTTTDAGGSVIAYASSTQDYIRAGSSTHAYAFGAGPSTVVSTPAATAKCAFWNQVGADYLFVVYDINHWEVDFDELESSLKDEEKGCGALTAWDYVYSAELGPAAKFALPTLMREGCVERAIGKAGGPDGGDTITCDGRGVSFAGPNESVEDVLKNV